MDGLRCRRRFYLGEPYLPYPVERLEHKLTDPRWPYESMPKCIQASGHECFTLHSQGTSEELDQLESSLASGRPITCLFCKIPSHPLCATPDLRPTRSGPESSPTSLVGCSSWRPSFGLPNSFNSCIQLIHRIVVQSFFRIHSIPYCPRHS